MLALERAWVCALIALAWAGCRAGGGSAVDAGPDLLSDAGDASTPDGGACPGLFGMPNQNTGLDATRCQPRCTCGGVAWAPQPWTQERLDGLLAWTLLDPPAELAADPYASAPTPIPDGSVCAVVVVDHAAKTYRLQTFASQADAEAAGAIVTHGGICGLCSPLADLAVYAGQMDLTQPVRQCGLDNVDHDGDVACLLKLGFTKPCAEIWAYNTNHTRSQCAATCFALLNAPYNTPDGGLNDCLECDEEQSGPVFKAVAGRTRRNTGVPSAICRPCSTVLHLDHDYQ